MNFVSIVAYIPIRCLTNKILNKTPYEAWTGMKPSVGHLKVFGFNMFQACASVEDKIG